MFIEVGEKTNDKFLVGKIGSSHINDTHKEKITSGNGQKHLMEEKRKHLIVGMRN